MDGNGDKRASQSSPPVRVVREDRLAVVTIHRPEARNALNVETMSALRDTALELARDPELVAVILEGEGLFSAGADLAENAFQGLGGSPTRAQIREFLKLGPDMCKAWEDLEPFTIAAIEGYCVGGAAALVAAMDHRIMGRSAFLRLPEIPLGINMSWQTLPRLVTQIGPARAKQYVMLGKRVAAPMALEWGLCESVTDDGHAFIEARALVDDLRRLPPLPLRMTKQAINAHANALNHVASFMDRDQYFLTAQTDDFQEAVRAFLEKREPKFRGN